MSSYARVLVLVSLLSAFLGACTLGPNGDYQVAVTWLINGTTPNADLCAEQRIARFRFEVRTGSGRVLKTVEADCGATILRADGNRYGGFLSTASFDWETDYFYALTPIDASGTALSPPAQKDFVVRFDEFDIYELPYFDYLYPKGSAASLAGEWRVGNGTDVAAACEAQGIKTVRIVAYSALDEDLITAFEVASAPCIDGKYASGTKVLARGFYNFFYEAVSGGGSSVAIGEPIQVSVDGPKDVVLPREVFLSK
ncbi:MAG: hypothetical protein RLZZ450_797 [Pseudomonadota bacterium]|jgi:hypothetical protein